jgi:glycerate kinase
VITGEGRFDEQSAQGKVTGRVIETARKAGKPVAVFAGQAPEGSGALTLMGLDPDPAAAMERAADLLSELAARWAGEFA